jgi:hypothetical protein
MDSHQAGLANDPRSFVSRSCKGTLRTDHLEAVRPLEYEVAYWERGHRGVREQSSSAGVPCLFAESRKARIEGQMAAA